MEFVECRRSGPVVSTQYGLYRGYYLRKVYHFLGMRYAVAERWKKPVSPQPWEGVKDALGYGFICPTPQVGMGWLPDDEEQFRLPRRFFAADEDCLFLNVWSSSLDRSAKKPVMLWIHGGGFSAGSATDLTSYDGEAMAGKEDVVIVSLNHRLNLLGYFDLTSLGEGFEEASNLGQYDIIAALKWIRGNIEAFGGDPENVTVMGQSGGGGKILALMQMPEADGLYHRAIVMSGVFYRPGEINLVDAHKALARAVVEEVCPGNPKALIMMPYQQVAGGVMAAQKKLAAQGIMTGWAPVPGNGYLGAYQETRMNEYARTVPVMVGGCYAEFITGKMPVFDHTPSEAEKEQAIRDAFGEKADKIMTEFRKAYPYKDVMTVLAMDRRLRRNNLAYCEDRARLAEAPTYAYLFALSQPFESLRHSFSDGDPAFHSCDIAFAMKNLHLSDLGSGGDTAVRVETEFSGAFAHMAKNGDPNFSQLPAWRPYQTGDGVTMVFDRYTYSRPDFDKELLEAVGQPESGFPGGGAPVSPKP